jgi:hypothetical protein
MKFYFYFLLITILFSTFSFSSEEGLSESPSFGYYFFKLTPHMKKLFDDTNKSAHVMVPKGPYLDANFRCMKLIPESHYFLKMRFSKINERLDELRSSLSDVQEDQQILAAKIIAREEELPGLLSELGLDYANANFFKKSMRKEDRRQGKKQKRQILNIQHEIGRYEKLKLILSPIVHKANVRVSEKITPEELLKYAKRKQPHVFDVSAKESQNLINKALERLLG